MHPLDHQAAIDARVTAATDQLGAALRNLAPALAVYQSALCESGFTRPEATALCADMQTSLLGAPERPL